LLDIEIDYNQIEKWLNIYYNAKYKGTKKQRNLLNTIVMACSPLVKRISLGLARRSYDPVEDIIQVGNIGLIRGIKKYSPEITNVKIFLSYAITWEIKHYLRDKVKLIKEPRSILELAYRLSHLSVEDLEKAGTEQIAQMLNVTKEHLQEVIDVERRHVISLDNFTFESSEFSFSYEEKLVYEKDDDIQKLQEDKLCLKNAIEKLPQKQKKIIKALYFDEILQYKLANQWHTSQSNISRLHKMALQNLFDIITKAQEEE